VRLDAAIAAGHVIVQGSVFAVGDNNFNGGAGVFFMAVNQCLQPMRLFLNAIQEFGSFCSNNDPKNRFSPQN
jgi:hypothetical protein